MSARGLLVAIAATVLAVGGALWAVRPSALPGRGAHVDGPLLVSADPGRFHGAEDALVLGRVTYDGRCMLLDVDVATYPAVWPHGTSWDEAALEVELPNGDRAAIGDEVTGGGGYHYVSDVVAGEQPYGDYGREGERILTDCAGPTGEVAVFSEGSVVTLAE